MPLKDRFQMIQQQIRQFSSEKVQLIGVSKHQSVEKIQELFDAGLSSFGENRVQEAKDKKPQLPKEIEWHLIGHLQKNKAKQAIELFDWIHSVDSWELAEILNREAEKQNRRPKVLLQVNIAEEPQKFGITVAELPRITEQMQNLSNLDWRGLMLMAPYYENIEDTRPIFYQGRMLFNQIQSQFGPQIQTLSMGMSRDFTVALSEGANMVRIGSALFNENANNERSF